MIPASSLITCAYHDDDSQARKKSITQLAEKLQLPLTIFPSPNYRYSLMYHDNILSLYENNLLTGKKQRPFYVDFLNTKLQHRTKHQSQFASELLFKAIGIKPTSLPTILDVTAGFATDAYLLATRGCHVTALERQGVIVALLEDALRRATDEDQSQHNVFQRLSIQQVQAEQYLPRYGHIFDVIYCDPMFAISHKSALAKKPMQILQAFTKQDEDQTSLALLAFQHAKRRLVVKRNLQANALLPQKPTFCVYGKTIRYDVYEKSKI